MRAGARFIHKKIPGVFDSAKDMLPVAHHDPLTLLSIYTHVMGWFPKVFKRTRSEQSAGKPPRALTWRNQTLMGGSGQQGDAVPADLIVEVVS